MDAGPVVICYDGSTNAARAIETAATLLGSRRALVLYISPLLTAAESLAATDALVPGNAFEDLNVAEGSDVARRGSELARAAGFDAEWRADLAAPTWEGIVAAADEVDAPVIVIGSRGLSGIRERLAGSVSHELAEHAGRPVLIVPPRREGRT